MILPLVIHMKNAAALSFGLLLMSSLAFAADAGRGHALAWQWCAQCHVIGKELRTSDVAPTFFSIAAKENHAPGTVRKWLSDPHPPMKGVSLSRAEIGDIIAYMKTLHPKP